MADPLSYHRRSLLHAVGVGLIAGLSAEGRGAAPSSFDGMPKGVPAGWANAEHLPLWPAEMPGDGQFAAYPIQGMPASILQGVNHPGLRIFRPAKSNGAAILVMPGGSYMILSIIHEGLDIATRLTASGYTVFVLEYRLPGEGWHDRANVPLQDAQRAMRLIRANARKFGIGAANVAAIGFSAGGHLCATLATGFAEPVYKRTDTIDEQDARPAAAGLLYPVITLEPPFAHRGSAIALLGPNPDPAQLRRRSTQYQVGPTTPPLFLAHAVDDPLVPLQNSLMMIEAMKAANRPVEAHIFADGRHGFGLGMAGTRAATWPSLFVAWLDQMMRVRA